MTYEVRLPDIGEGVAEGEIVRWLVRAGEAVREDQPLVEVMTDKASVEIPAPRTGTIAALHAEEGAMVPVGTVIVTIDVATPAGAPAPAAPAHAPAAPAAAPAPAAPAAAAPAARVEATPAVRALAKELGVALESVHGTGAAGRIVADDVRRAAAGGAPPAPAAAPAPAAGTRVPLRGLRRRIAEQMRHSLSTAAQFTFVGECDFTAVVEHRAAVAAQADAAGVKLTYLAYVLRALPEVLARFPYLNASLDDAAQEIVLHPDVHLGVATATDEGLTVPVLHDAGRRGLFAVARDLERLAAAARARQIPLEQLRGATFTVTSTGAKGGVLATPIVHHPQVAILGVHAIGRKPAVRDDRVVIRELGNLSLSMDHRVVDGAVGADFLYALVERLEHPAAWLNEGDLR